MVEQVVEPDIMVGAFDPRATVQVDALALRKWCVDQATHLPVVTSFDLVASAQEILDWVTKAP